MLPTPNCQNPKAVHELNVGMCDCVWGQVMQLKQYMLLVPDKLCRAKQQTDCVAHPKLPKP